MRFLVLFMYILFCTDVYGEQTDSIQLSNATLYYYTQGSGEPIVLLAGGPGIASHQIDDLGQMLAKHYKVIYFDQRGTGKSWSYPMDTTTINLETAVNDLEILRKHLGISKLRIAGHSWGGILTAAYTAHYPKKVQQVIIIGGGELSPDMTPAVDGNIVARYQLGDTVAYDYWSDSVNAVRAPDSAHYELRKLKWAPISYDRSKLDDILKQAEHGTFTNAVNNLMWKSLLKPHEDWVALLQKKYKGKSLIVFGWQDPIGLTTLTQYKEAFPKAIVKGINECGHMPSVEQPAIFYKTILDFLQH